MTVLTGPRARLRVVIAEATAALAELEAAESALITPVVVAPSPVPVPGGIADPAAFFATMKRTPVLGPTLTQGEVDGCNAILAACIGLPASWVAYALATAFHETKGAMQPNVEDLYYTTAKRVRQVWPTRFPTDASATPFLKNPKALANKVYNGRMGNREGSGDGWDFRGRGLPHLTGRANYDKATIRLKAMGIDVDLVANPDLALRPDVAAAVLRFGMVEGWFTKKSFSTYLPARADRNNFIGARKIVNPDANAAEIADIALLFQTAVNNGKWVM